MFEFKTFFWGISESGECVIRGVPKLVFLDCAGLWSSARLIDWLIDWWLLTRVNGSYGWCTDRCRTAASLYLTLGFRKCFQKVAFDVVCACFPLWLVLVHGSFFLDWLVVRLVGWLIDWWLVIRFNGLHLWCGNAFSCSFNIRLRKISWKMRVWLVLFILPLLYCIGW